MLDLKFAGLVIRDKNSNILAIARERYDGMLIFGALDENEENEPIALFKTTKEAERSFRAKVSKKSYLLSEKVAKEIEDNFGYAPFEAWRGFRLNTYEEMKSVVSTINLNVNYEED